MPKDCPRENFKQGWVGTFPSCPSGLEKYIVISRDLEGLQNSNVKRAVSGRIQPFGVLTCHLVLAKQAS